jgi:hypothetical protein
MDLHSFKTMACVPSYAMQQLLKLIVKIEPNSYYTIKPSPILHIYQNFCLQKWLHTVQWTPLLALEKHVTWNTNTFPS